MNLTEKKNINGFKNENDSKSIIPDNYNILKCIHLSMNSKQYKWYILEKIKTEYKPSSSTSDKKNKKSNIINI